MTKFEEYLQKTKEYGIVEEVRHPIVICSGLPGARINEVIVFEDDTVGQIASLNLDTVEILTFAKTPIKSGMKVARTDDKLFIPVGEELLGQIVNPLGETLYGESLGEIPAKREIDIAPHKIDKRVRITRQFYTGVSIVDSVLPLGKGQRELIVGDRKTGKTSFVLNISKTIARETENDLVVYASIGKEKSDSKRLKTLFEKELEAKRVVVVASSADQSPSLIDLTPYSAMTIAEYFRDQGRDVLVVLDDLTTHAKFYREMALLGKHFPGRDSYPGDIFYKHARLLERGGNFKVGEDKEASITVLPIGETQDSTLTDYIVSSLIGITDGHILFDMEAFNRGMRPAIDIFLSVTRVGKQTQTPLMRDITRNSIKLLKKYKDTLTYQHFGAELSSEAKKILDKGEKVYKFFEQNPEVSVPLPVQALFLVLLIEGTFIKRRLSDMVSYRSALTDRYRKDPEVKTRIDSIFNAPTYSDSLKIIDQNTAEIFKWLGFLK